MNIKTLKGSVSLLKPTPELVRAVQAHLPFGLVGLCQPGAEVQCGLVMQCGGRKLCAVKQQPVDGDERQAYVSFTANSILIAHSLPGYLAHGFSGLLLPCAYLRQKEGGRFESGIAYFGYPSLRGRESREYPYEPAWDRQFGHGFTIMMISFIKALQTSSKETGITLSPAIGLDVRPWTQLGSLALGFMVIGRHVVCLKTPVSERDPTWTALRRVGITEVYHLPSVPTTIAEDELTIAKPAS